MSILPTLLISVLLLVGCTGNLPKEELYSCEALVRKEPDKLNIIRLRRCRQIDLIEIDNVPVGQIDGAGIVKLREYERGQLK